MNHVRVFAQLPKKQVLTQPRLKKQLQNDCQNVLSLYFLLAVIFHL